MSKKKRTLSRRVHHTPKRRKDRKKFILFLIPLFLVALIPAVYYPKTASVLGISTVAFRRTTVTWPSVSGAASYNIYYKSKSDLLYIHAVSNIPATLSSFTIDYLKKGVTYQYYVTAVDGSGKEFWSSPVKTM